MSPLLLGMEVTGPGAVSCWNRTTTEPMPAAATRAATMITPSRRAPEGLGPDGSLGPIARARACTSGTWRSSSERNASRRSFILLLQERAELSTSLRQMHAHRRLRTPEDVRDLSGRAVCVHRQDHGRPLVGAQRSERA